MIADTSRPSSYLQHVSIHVLIWSNLIMAPLVFIAHMSAEIGLVYLGLYIISFVFIFPFMTHSRRATCFHCMRSFPASPTQEVEQRKKDLANYHFFFGGRKVLLCIIGGYFAIAMLFNALDIPMVIMSVFSCFYSLVFAELWASARWHGRLVPWCPICKHRGDSEAIEEPSPTLPEGMKKA